MLAVAALVSVLPALARASLLSRDDSHNHGFGAAKYVTVVEGLCTEYTYEYDDSSFVAALGQDFFAAGDRCGQS